MAVNRWAFNDYYYGRGSLYRDRGYEQLNAEARMAQNESKGYRQSMRFALHDARTTNQGAMNASARKSMRSFYYRQQRKAQGLAAG